MDNSMLTPVLALVSWSLLVWMLMYIRRIPAMQKADIKPQDAQYPGALNALPGPVRAAADNYNHLMEQPTIFYALAFYMHLVGVSGQLAVTLAWAYVAIRVLHSLTQITVNIVLVRFSLFSLSTLCLFGLAIISLLAL